MQAVLAQSARPLAVRKTAAASSRRSICVVRAENKEIARCEFMYNSVWDFCDSWDQRKGNVVLRLVAIESDGVDKLMRLSPLAILVPATLPFDHRCKGFLPSEWTTFVLVLDILI